MDSIVAQIHALAESADEGDRLKIQIALRKALSELQSPKDVVIDLINSVCGHGVPQFTLKLTTLDCAVRDDPRRSRHRAIPYVG